jgi:hypothetical protein
MTIEEFNEAIFDLIGVRGPAGASEAEGKPYLIYRIDKHNAHKIITPPDLLTYAQRQNVIDELKLFIAQLEMQSVTTKH